LPRHDAVTPADAPPPAAEDRQSAWDEKYRAGVPSLLAEAERGDALEE
jgi:hypothetical protein